RILLAVNDERWRGKGTKSITPVVAVASKSREHRGACRTDRVRWSESRCELIIGEPRRIGCAAVGAVQLRVRIPQRILWNPRNRLALLARESSEDVLSEDRHPSTRRPDGVDEDHASHSGLIRSCREHADAATPRVTKN